MRLATLDDGTRDGTLVVVDSSGLRVARATAIAPTLQAALDAWETVSPRLQQLAAALESPGTGELLDPEHLLAPLPRAYEWIDGSAFLHHIRLARQARGAEIPANLTTNPLVYQGGSGVLLSPRAPIELGDPSWGLDYEAEVAVILGDTPRGTRPEQAEACVRLILLANDVTYRTLVPGELDKGFGFFCSKPATAFSPFALTPDELGDAWRDGRVHLPMVSYRNDVLQGDPDAGEAMHFSFFDLIGHIAQTRSFVAGTILGSGTVSNEDPARGVSCLAERRMREKLEHGEMQTNFLQLGDRIRIEMPSASGHNLFGSIEQDVVPYRTPPVPLHLPSPLRRRAT